jgi:hypothetical protein
MDSITYSLNLNDRVKVRPFKISGEPHPHAGRVGFITEFFTLEKPFRAMIRLADGPSVGHFAVITLACLEKV